MTTWPNGWPAGVAVGDIDGDGRDDAIVANSRTQQGANPDDFKLFIFHQGADKSLSNFTTVAYSSESIERIDDVGSVRTETAIAATDLDGDGIVDVVVGQRGGFAFVKGRRDRAYAPRRIESSTGSSVEHFAFLDADNDGYVDIATMNHFGTSTGISVYFGDAETSFSRSIFMPTLIEGINDLRTGDLNGDGIKDLVLSFGQGPSQRVEIRYGNGSGSFSAPHLIPKPASMITLRTAVVGDFVGRDGRDDLIVAGLDRELFDGGRVFLYPQVGGVLQSEAIHLPSAMPTDSSWIPDRSIAADMNGDGQMDWVVLRSGGYISYFEQKDGQLTIDKLFAGPYMTWGGLMALSVGDLNSDGCRDVAASNYNYGLVVWYGLGCANATP